MGGVINKLEHWIQSRAQILNTPRLSQSLGLLARKGTSTPGNRRGWIACGRKIGLREVFYQIENNPFKRKGNQRRRIKSAREGLTLAQRVIW